MKYITRQNVCECACVEMHVHAYVCMYVLCAYVCACVVYVCECTDVCEVVNVTV